MTGGLCSAFFCGKENGIAPMSNHEKSCCRPHSPGYKFIQKGPFILLIMGLVLFFATRLNQALFETLCNAAYNSNATINFSAFKFSHNSTECYQRHLTRINASSNDTTSFGISLIILACLWSSYRSFMRAKNGPQSLESRDAAYALPTQCFPSTPPSTTWSVQSQPAPGYEPPPPYEAIQPRDNYDGLPPPPPYSTIEDYNKPADNQQPEHQNEQQQQPENQSGSVPS